MKKFLHEFKEFALRGNIMDLAIGVIIGGAFQKIINSLVGDIITPLLGLIGKADFSTLTFTVRDVPVRYGAFVTEVINFLLMAFVIFLLLKGMNTIANIGKKEEEEEVTTRECPFCLSTVSIKATRCAHCTSELPDYEKKD